MELDKVNVSGDATIKTTTGDVELEDFDAANIYIKVTSGNVVGTILSSKNFNAASITGDVKVPQTTEGGICEIKATTGNINIQYSK